MSADLEQVCCICGKAFVGWGNNPWPVVKDVDSVCCNECNATRVIPERIKGLTNNGCK